MMATNKTKIIVVACLMSLSFLIGGVVDHYRGYIITPILKIAAAFKKKEAAGKPPAKAEQPAVVKETVTKTPEKPSVPEIKPYKGASAEVLQYAFTDEWVYNISYSHNPVNTIDGVRAILDRFLIFSAEDYFNSSAGRPKIESEAIISAVPANVTSIKFNYTGKTGNAYAYRKEQLSGACSILVIPGTGRNQSSKIVRGEDYHGKIFDVLGEYCDVFVFIKPNEDFRSIHNGQHKLNYDFIIVGAINSGRSYTVNYLTEAMALFWHLKSKYGTVGIAGLSQGGSAALFTSLKVDSDFVITSSGFSTLQRKLLWANLEQMVVPGIFERFSLKNIGAILKNSKTPYFFSYGRQEGGDYRVETVEKTSCDWLKSQNKNVVCVIHDGGHEFPMPQIRKFLAGVLGK